MGQINVGIDNLSPQHIDRSYGKTVLGVTTPYASVAEALAAVNINFRHKGKTIVINDGSGLLEYWWKNGTADVDLVLKSSLGAPVSLILSANGTYTIPENLIIDMIVVVPTVTFNLKIGMTAGAEDLMPSIPMQANQANVVTLQVPAWGDDVIIYFTGPTATTEFLIYRRTLIPINS